MEVDSICSFSGCFKKLGRNGAKGLCIGHYTQQFRGKPLVELRRRAPARFVEVNWPIGRRCVECLEMLPFLEFSLQSTGAHGHLATCKKCTQVSTRARGLGNYGLTAEGFDALLADQHGRCAICGAPEPGGRGAWHIDHDHSCCPPKHACDNCRRGLLCAMCNIALGTLKDEAILLSAIAYLKKNQLSGVSNSLPILAMLPGPLGRTPRSEWSSAFPWASKAFSVGP